MDKINLNDIKDKYFTGRKKKIKIEGSAKDMEVYHIPIELLYYNDQNDRIATYISKYDNDHKDKPFATLPTHDKNRNDIIERYIIDSDKGNFDIIKEHIKDNSQMDPGVVLSDGRVIDGNRRFTSLRSLRKATGKQDYAFFDTVILDDKVDSKQIKIMELILQQGLPPRLKYNPIERLVGVYRDLIRDKRLTIREYADSINESENEVKKLIDLAYLMEDFLQYINCPQQFYLAKEFEIDGPLRELYRVKKKIEADEDYWYKTKVSVYNMMIVRPEVNGNKDTTRNVRDFLDNIALHSDKLNQYFNEHEDDARIIFEQFRNNGDNDKSLDGIHEIDSGNIPTESVAQEKDRPLKAAEIKDNSKEEKKNTEVENDEVTSVLVGKQAVFNNVKNIKKAVSEHMGKKLGDSIYEAKQEKRMTKPIDYLIDASKLLKKIDERAIKDLDMLSRVKFLDELDKIEEIIHKINNDLGGQN